MDKNTWTHIMCALMSIVATCIHTQSIFCELTNAVGGHTWWDVWQIATYANPEGKKTSFFSQTSDVTSAYILYNPVHTCTCTYTNTSPALLPPYRQGSCLWKLAFCNGGCLSWRGVDSSRTCHSGRSCLFLQP